MSSGHHSAHIFSSHSRWLTNCTSDRQLCCLLVWTVFIHVDGSAKKGSPYRLLWARVCSTRCILRVGPTWPCYVCELWL